MRRDPQWGLLQNNKSLGLWPYKAKNMIVLSIWDYSAMRRDPLCGVLQRRKSLMLRISFFCSGLRAKASFALAGNKKTGLVPGFFFFGGEGGIRTPGTLTSSAV